MDLPTAGVNITMEAWFPTQVFTWPPRRSPTYLFCLRLALSKQAVLGSFPELVGIDGAVDARLQSLSADYRPDSAAQHACASFAV